MVAATKLFAFTIRSGYVQFFTCRILLVLDTNWTQEKICVTVG